MRIKFIFLIIGVLTTIFLTACWDDDGDATTPSISTAFTETEPLPVITVLKKTAPQMGRLIIKRFCD